MTKLVCLSKDSLTDKASPAFLQVNGVDPQRYRMNRRLSQTERIELVEQYQSGKSTYQLARQFGTDRHTIARHLRHQGVELRPQRRMTQQFIERARQLYTAGSSLATIAKLLGVSPTTVGKALVQVGVALRDTHGREPT